MTTHDELNFNENKPQFFTNEEAAKYLNVSTHWLKASRQKPEFDGPPYRKLGPSMIRYGRHDLEEWLDRRKFRGTYEYALVNGRTSKEGEVQ